jgi:sensor histidine kinase YesM/ligand-binding sensor domain-containing protein
MRHYILYIAFARVMKRYIVYSFIFFSFFFIKQACAQSFNFRNYTVEDGLPYVQIYDAFQDDKGYLWTGGYGGLSSFDGVKFSNYSPRQGLINYWVTSISQDSAKNLIVGTLEGLSVFNGKKFVNYTTKNGLPNNYIHSIANKGAETAIATRSGLCYLSNNEIKKDFRFINVDIIKIKRVFKDYLASTNRKIYVVSKDNVKTICEFSASSDTLITSVETDKNSTLWIGTNKGLFYISNFDLQNTLKKAVSTIIKEGINCVYVDYKNVLWIGTNDKLLTYFNDKVASYQISKDENANNIYCITSDYEQNIWIGTRGGLFQFRDEGFVSFGKEDGLKNAFIHGIAIDKKNNIWFGTAGGGIYKYDNKQFTNYTTGNGLSGNIISGLLYDSLNRLWIGTDKGLCYEANDQIKASSFLSKDLIYCVFLDKKNNLWLGLKDKIARIENINKYPNTKVSYFNFPLPVNITDFQMSSMCQGSNGTVYMASFLGGLFMYDGKEIKDITNLYRIKTRTVVDVTVSSNNYLFVATLDGIYIINLDNKSVEKVTEDDGLSSNLVYSLFITDNGQTLWAGTNQGANKIDLQSFFQSHVKNILSFGKTEGFKGLECNTGGLCKDSSGSVWFGTVNGLVKHNPVKYVSNDNEARLSFTKMKLFYNDTLLPQNAQLASNLNNIRFDFMGICLTNPEKVLYIHKLEGFEKSWSPTTNQNNVTYSNLPPSNYIFKVRCCNNQGVWSTEPLSFSFSVDAPYYKRWWFIVSVLTFIALIVFTLFRVRLNQLKREQEKESKTQIEIAKNELKALRAQMNPHFLFNSLNSIQHYIISNKGDEAVFYLNRFAKLMRMILANSEKTTITLNEEINGLKIYMELEKMRFSNLFDFDIKIENTIDADYEQIPSMLLQPYVENAILHGLVPKNGEGLLQINFFIKDNFLHVTIQDNGIGRKKSAEIKSHSTKSHASMGMKITKDRLRLLSDVQQVSYNVIFTDLQDAQGNATGTIVEITWPII